MFRRTFILLFALIVAFAAVNVSSTQAQTYCMSVGSRLYAGVQAMVTPGLPNVLRAEPVQGNGNAILAYIPAGGVFTVMNGPACNGGITWWQVSYNGVIGWTPEGQWNTYWAEPITYVPTPIPVSCPLPPRLYSGSVGRVTEGLPNRLRLDPTLNGRVLRYIPAGGFFTVMSNAVCADGMYWYQVNYNGAVGWTAEGRGNMYWLEPA